MANDIKIPVEKLDPFTFTGPTRSMAGVMQTGDVTLDAYYGEFARWLYVGVAGNVSYTKWDGTTQVLTGLLGGVWHPICSVRVNSTGTTATNLVWGS